VARASQHRASRALSAGPRARARIRVGSMGRTGLVRARAPAIQWGLLDCKGIVEGSRVPCRAVAEGDEALEAREVFSTLRGWATRLSCRAGRCYEKEWLTRARMKRGKWAVPLHFHRCILHARACHGTDHSDDVRDSRTGCCRYHLHDAIQTVTLRVWHRVARGHTHALDLSRDAE